MFFHPWSGGIIGGSIILKILCLMLISSSKAWFRSFSYIYTLASINHTFELIIYICLSQPRDPSRHIMQGISGSSLLFLNLLLPHFPLAVGFVSMRVLWRVLPPFSTMVNLYLLLLLLMTSLILLNNSEFGVLGIIMGAIVLFFVPQFFFLSFFWTLLSA